MEDKKIKCVTLNGELADWGKHILLPYGITLCGMPTIDVDKEQFPVLKDKNFADMIFEYTNEEWEITCEKCLNMIDIIKNGKK
jgi:hypothetical protein